MTTSTQRRAPGIPMATVLALIFAAYLAGQAGMVGLLLDVTPPVADVAEVSR